MSEEFTERKQIFAGAINVRVVALRLLQIRQNVLPVDL